MAQGIYFRQKNVKNEVLKKLEKNQENLEKIFENCSNLESVKVMVKKLGYRIDKLPLWYIENLMSKNFYSETPELEYPEFLLLLVRLSVEFKFDIEKTIPKMLKA